MHSRDVPIEGFVHKIANLLKKNTFSRDELCLVGPICDEGRPTVLAALREKLGRGCSLWVEGQNAREREQLKSVLADWGEKAWCWIEGDTPFGNQESLGEVLQSLARKEGRVMIVPEGWRELLSPSVDSLQREGTSFVIGGEVDLEPLVQELLEHGYERVPSVFRAGQFAIRGGILDIYSLTSSVPVRIELFDVEIESIREFDLDTQVSTKSLERWQTQWVLSEEAGCLGDYLQENDIVIGFNTGGENLEEGLVLTNDPVGYDVELEVLSSPFPAMNPGDFVMQEASHMLVKEQLATWVQEDWEIYLASGVEGERRRFFEIIGDQWRTQDRVYEVHRNILHTLVIPSERIALISLSELFGRYQKTTRVTAQAEFWQSAASRHAKTEELSSGDLVVHAEYGVGQLLEVSDPEGEEEAIQIEYDNGAILEVPIGQAHLVAKYVGVGGQKPKLSKLGDAKWSKLKEKARGAVIDYAARLLRVQAERALEEGTAHPPDTNHKSNNPTNNIIRTSMVLLAGKLIFFCSKNKAPAVIDK